MPFHPRFSYDDQLVRDLMRIEGARHVVDVLPLPLDIGIQLRHEARQRSTHFSTKIEGNPIAQQSIPHAIIHLDRSPSEHELEVRNYWKALDWIEQKVDEGAQITEDLIKGLHQIIMPGGAGRRRRSEYRDEEWGVMDSVTRNWTYQAPEPRHAPTLMRELVEWRQSPEATALPGPLRAGILGYQFVTIHPFKDGNGRTTRALATMSLWQSGYSLKNFLSMEEHYSRDRAGYYASLQMGLPINYYEGRNDPDLTPWLKYFVGIMAQASEDVARRAEELFKSRSGGRDYPWTPLGRLKQQMLSRCVLIALEQRSSIQFTPAEIQDWFSVSRQTAYDWLDKWRKEGFVAPASGEVRVTPWKLTPEFETIIHEVREATRCQDQK